MKHFTFDVPHCKRKSVLSHWMIHVMSTSWFKESIVQCSNVKIRVSFANSIFQNAANVCRFMNRIFTSRYPRSVCRCACTSFKYEKHLSSIWPVILNNGAKGAMQVCVRLMLSYYISVAIVNELHINSRSTYIL